MPNSTVISPVSLFKRLLCIAYDLILLTAICFAVGVVFSSLTTFIVNDGHAITEEHSFYYIHQIITLSSILATSFFFYVWFWTHGGQTLGMKTWHIQLISNNGLAITQKQAAKRYFAALLSWAVMGVGFLWCLIDAKQRCWHDILSSSSLMQLKKE